MTTFFKIEESSTIAEVCPHLSKYITTAPGFSTMFWQGTTKLTDLDVTFESLLTSKAPIFVRTEAIDKKEQFTNMKQQGASFPAFQGHTSPRATAVQTPVTYKIFPSTLTHTSFKSFRQTE